MVGRFKKILLTGLVYSLLTVHAFASSLINVDNRDEVYDLQIALVSAGYSIAVDGYWGNETKKAVSEFQENVGLKNTGDVDNDTLYALNRYVPEVSRGSRKMIVESTGYTRYDEGCGDYTATGEFLHKGIIAVDPSIIPLGTRVYIPGYGVAIASDTGGAIVGNKIDLAFDSKNEAFSWGRRTTVIYIM